MYVSADDRERKFRRGLAFNDSGHQPYVGASVSRMRVFGDRVFARARALSTAPPCAIWPGACGVVVRLWEERARRWCSADGRLNTCARKDAAAVLTAVTTTTAVAAAAAERTKRFYIFFGFLSKRSRADRPPTRSRLDIILYTCAKVDTADSIIGTENDSEAMILNKMCKKKVVSRLRSSQKNINIFFYERGGGNAPFANLMYTSIGGILSTDHESDYSKEVLFFMFNTPIIIT